MRKLKREIPGSRHDRNQLPCRCILHLIPLSLKQAQAKPESFRPFNDVVPADHRNQTEEWRNNMAEKVPNPKNYFHSKMTLNTNQVLNVLPIYVSVFHLCV